MIKAIFVLESLTKEKISISVSLGANTIFTSYQNITHETVHYARDKGLTVNLEVGIFVGEDLWQKYPDSRPIDRSGKPIEKIHWYAGVCPNHPQIRQEKLTLIKKILREYNIDGIWLDFIRYPCHWEEVRNSKIEEYCYCQNCLNQFKQCGGSIPEGEQLTAWKCKQITDFVKDVKIEIEKLSNKIDLGMFAVPWQKDDFDSAILRIIGQDFKTLSKYVDTFSLMTYHKFSGRPVSWIGDMVNYMSRVTNKKILPIIQTEDRAGKITKEEFDQEITNAIAKDSAGVIFFLLEDLIKDHDKITCQEVF